MNNDFEEETGQFKLNIDDDINESSLAPNVDELRLEKISQRVTFISILIPVLIIIVLVIAYLDIKKRMSYTEDTGTMEFQKLSSDLESRFGSLSLRQAKLEEDLIRFSQTQDKSMANSNVKLDQLKKTFNALRPQLVTQKEFNKVRNDFAQQNNTLSQQIGAAVESVDQADQQIAVMTQELKTQIARIGETLTARNKRMEELEQRITDVDVAKIDEQELDLKLRLKTLKIQQDLKVKLDALGTELNRLSKKVTELSAKPTSAPTPPPQKKASPKPIQPPPAIEEKPLSN